MDEEFLAVLLLSVVEYLFEFPFWLIANDHRFRAGVSSAGELSVIILMIKLQD